MNKRIVWRMWPGLILSGHLIFAQERPVPQEVNHAFNQLFPQAKNVVWRDKITDFQVTFSDGGKRCEAKFQEKGNWISIEKSITTDSLPAIVKTGLSGSKYADWKILSSFVEYLPGGPTQYHLVVTKDDAGRKLLLFNDHGKLLRDNFSL